MLLIMLKHESCQRAPSRVAIVNGCLRVSHLTIFVANKFFRWVLNFRKMLASNSILFTAAYFFFCVKFTRAWIVLVLPYIELSGCQQVKQRSKYMECILLNFLVDLTSFQKTSYISSPASFPPYSPKPIVTISREIHKVCLTCASIHICEKRLMKVLQFYRHVILREKSCSLKQYL